MSEKHLTIEEVDKELAELEAKHAHKLVGEGIAPEDILTKVCSLISIAVPILKFVKVLLFFKPKWRDILQQIIDTAGTACSEV